MRGRAAVDDGRLAEAREFYEQAIRMLDALGDERDAGLLSNDLGIVLEYQGDLDGAMTRYRRSAAVASRAEDTGAQARATVNIANVHSARSEWPAAIAAYESAGTALRQIGAHKDEAAALVGLAHAHVATGDAAAATAEFEAAAKIRREVQDRHGEARALNDLGMLQRETGNAGDAARSLQRAIELFIDVGDVRAAMRPLTNLGTLLMDAGLLDGAAICFEQGADLAGALGDREAVGAWQARLGGVRLAQGDHRGAAELLQGALDALRVARSPLQAEVESLLRRAQSRESR